LLQILVTSELECQNKISGQPLTALVVVELALLNKYPWSWPRKRF